MYPGGELAFVRRMIADSQQLRGRVHWYTSMLGKKASLKRLRTELMDAGATALRTTEFAQVSAAACTQRRKEGTSWCDHCFLCAAARRPRLKCIGMA